MIINDNENIMCCMECTSSSTITESKNPITPNLEMISDHGSQEDIDRIANLQPLLSDDAYTL